MFSLLRIAVAVQPALAEALVITIDLAFTAHGTAWIVAELLRTATGISMQEAGRLIELVHAPIGDLVEEIDDVTLIHGDMSASDEVMILLHTAATRTT